MLIATRCALYSLIIALSVLHTTSCSQSEETSVPTSAERHAATAEVIYQEVAPEAAERNVLRFEIDTDCRVQMDGKYSRLNEVREAVKSHVLNQGMDPRFAESTEEAMVVIIPAGPQAECEATLEAVVDETQVAYLEIWDSAAWEHGFRWYEDYLEQLEPGAPDEIRSEVQEQVYVITSSR